MTANMSHKTDVWQMESVMKTMTVSSSVCEKVLINVINVIEMYFLSAVLHFADFGRSIPFNRFGFLGFFVSFLWKTPTNMSEIEWNFVRSPLEGDKYGWMCYDWRLFSVREIEYLRKNRFFFRKKLIFFGRNRFSPEEIDFFQEKIIFPGQNEFFRRKMTFSREIVFSSKENDFFSRKIDYYPKVSLDEVGRWVSKQKE